MAQGVVFVVVLVLVAFVALRMKLGPIVSLGGGFILALVATALVPQEGRQPARSIDGAQYAALVDKSDDYAIYKEAFAEAAGKLISKGECSAGDFSSQGGWVRSTVRPDTYFVLCGGSRVENRVFLIPGTGETYRSTK